MTRWRRVLRPRARRVDLTVALLLGVLGFAAVVQVRSTQDEGPLANARQEDLVQILDDLSNRDDRLRAEVAALEATRRELTSGTDTAAAALTEARRRAQLLGVLAGTVPAAGPGVRLTITDPEGKIGPERLLDALEELRAAGAEAVQIEGPAATTVDTEGAAAGTVVRVVASTSFTEASADGGAVGGVRVDGTLLRPPYRFDVIGDAPTLAAALAIPGGVVDAVEQAGGRATIEKSEQVLVGALRVLTTPRYARPTP